MLHPWQTEIVNTVEKVSSCLSVAGEIFIICTFLSDVRFRKPINRLVFYAAWGNMFANMATLMSMSGIRMGVTSPLCQFQAFLIQWMMFADATWNFAMAINVYLAFFRQYDATKLRKMEWKYLLTCYGIPFIPALTYLFIETPSRGKVFGSAALWCWVSVEWKWLRIATFYGPIWIVLLTIMTIYIRVGLIVLKQRKELILMDAKQPHKVITPAPSRARSPEPIQTSSVQENDQQCHPYQNSLSPTAAQFPQNAHSHQLYQTQLSSTNAQFAPDSIKRQSYQNYLSPTSAQFPRDVQRPQSQHSHMSSLSQLDRTGGPGCLNLSSTAIHLQKPRKRSNNPNKASMAYFKTAILFFIALLCTWVPSTCNRVYGLVKNKPSPFALDLVSGLVLPLQGFWNTVIYVATSRACCKALFNNAKERISSGFVRFTRPSIPAIAPCKLRGLSVETADTNQSTLNILEDQQPGVPRADRIHTRAGSASSMTDVELN